MRRKRAAAACNGRKKDSYNQSVMLSPEKQQDEQCDSTGDFVEHFELTEHVRIAIIALYGFIFALLGILFFVKKVFHKHVDNLWIRTKSFLGIVLFFSVVFLCNKITAFLGLALISYLCLKEFFSLIPTRRTDRIAILWAYLSIPITYYILYTHWMLLFYLFIPLYMFMLLAARMVISGNTEGFLKNLAVLQFGLMITVYAVGYLGLIAQIPLAYNPKGGSLGLLFYILVFTIANDFMQMFCGKAFGKHKIIPKVSPNKTWEGFLGGVVGSTFLSMGMGYYLTPLSLPELAWVGAGLAITGFFGDVTMSAIKRDMGVKDTSTLIPGHGGILDRLDSLLFTAPLFFHYLAYTFKIMIRPGM